MLHLDLSYNNLSNIQLGTFSNQWNLISLHLSHNFFKSIDFGLFSPRFDHLRSLIIESNELSDLDGFSRIVFPKLNSLAINGNNFNCSVLRFFFSTLHWSRDGIISLRLVYNMDPKNYEKTNIIGIPCDIISDATEKSVLDEIQWWLCIGNSFVRYLCIDAVVYASECVCIHLAKVTVHKLDRGTKYNCNCGVGRRNTANYLQSHYSSRCCYFLFFSKNNLNTCIYVTMCTLHSKASLTGPTDFSITLTFIHVHLWTYPSPTQFRINRMLCVIGIDWNHKAMRLGMFRIRKNRIIRQSQ